MMLTISFWNTYGNSSHHRNIDQLMAKLIKENHIDIMVMCEYSDNLQALCSVLEFDEMHFNSAMFMPGERIRLLYSKDTVEPPILIRGQDHYSVYRFPERRITIVGVHLISNMHADDETRKAEAALCKNDIEEYESECGDQNTIVLGDFNADPYESTMLSSLGFHALPFQKKAEKLRKVAQKEQMPFYNPMWNMFGDFTEPVGTYYMSTTNAVDPMWHIYDQFLLRGRFARNVVRSSMRIIGKIGDIDLCTEYGIPNREIASDHLPIIMSLEV